MRNVEIETVIKICPYVQIWHFDENQGNYVFDMGDPESGRTVRCRVAPFAEEGLDVALGYYGIDDSGLFICRGDGYGSLGFALSIFFG